MYEENGFSVEIVRKHIAMREKAEKLREQFEEVKSEIAKLITEKAEIEEHFEAMKEAKDHQIAFLTLKRIVIEEDMTDMERDFQTSVASLGITDGSNLDMGSISTKSSVGLKVCSTSNIKWNNQVASTEVTSQVDSSPISEKNGYNLVSDKYMDLDAEKHPAGQLSSSGAYGSVTRIIEGLLSQKKKLSEGSRSLRLMRKQSKKEVLKSDRTIPQIIDLEDENDSLQRLAIVPFVKARDKSSRTIQSPKADNKCHFASSEEKSSRPMPFIYLKEDEDPDTEQLQVLTNESDTLDSLGSGGQLETNSGEKVHKKKGGRPRKILGGCVLYGNNSVVEGSDKPGYTESDGQLQMKTCEEVPKTDGQLQMKTAGKKVLKRKGGRPRKFDGFMVASDFPRKRKKRIVLESDAEYSLPKSQKTTEKGKDAREELVGSRIKVWWPADQQYYEGIVESYDPTRKKHKVAYFDGDKENLILKKERWLRDDEKSESQQVSAAIGNVGANSSLIKHP